AAGPVPRLLVVDDERDIALVVKIGLERHGFSVDTANRPGEALEKFAKAAYDLVILDMRLPEMDGLALYQKMKEMRKDTRMCFLTAYDKEYYRGSSKKFNDLPDKCFIHKPVSLPELVKLINAELE
ncbi:MAG: response regulator, partial [Thermoproteota archaeon]